jgi:chorismate mutase
MNINLLRENIDKIDQQILKLLSDRMQQAVMIRKFKEKSEDKERELEVLKKVAYSANSRYLLLDSSFIEKLYKMIIEESKRIQNTSHVS